MEYNIVLTEDEVLAAETVIVDIQEWTQNAISNRARIATNDIVQLTVKNCLELGMPIPQTTHDMIVLAYEQGWVKKAEVPTPTAS